MRRLLVPLLVLAFTLGLTALGGCDKDPCPKAWEKMQECAKKSGAGEGDLAKLKPQFDKACKKDKSKFRKCLKKGDCQAFDRCIE